MTKVRTALENQYDFTISQGAAKVITTAKLTSYTMLITRSNPDPTYFENLVLQEDSNHNLQGAIIRYTPTNLTNELTHKSFEFNGYLNIKTLQLNTTGPYTNYKGCFIDVVMCNYGGSEHVAGECCRRTFVKAVWDPSCATNSNGGNGAGTVPNPVPTPTPTTPANSNPTPTPNSGPPAGPSSPPQTTNPNNNGTPPGGGGTAGGDSVPFFGGGGDATPPNNNDNTDNNGIVTAPVTSETDANTTPKPPCMKVKELLDNYPIFKQKLKLLAAEVQNATHEKLVALYKDGTDAEFEGVNGVVELDPNPMKEYLGTAHIHDPVGAGNGTFSVHSFGDINWLAVTDILHSKVNLNKFVSFLATADGTFYALTVTDKAKFRNAFNYLKYADPNITNEERAQYLSKINIKQTLYDKYFQKSEPHPTYPLIKENGTDSEKDLENFINFIAEGDFGISVLETDANFETFAEVKKKTEPSQTKLPRTQCPN